MSIRQFRRRSLRRRAATLGLLTASFGLVADPAASQVLPAADAEASPPEPSVESPADPAAEALVAIRAAAEVVGADEGIAPLVEVAGEISGGSADPALAVSQTASDLIVEASAPGDLPIRLVALAQGGSADGAIEVVDGVAVDEAADEVAAVERMVDGFRFTRTVASADADPTASYRLELPEGWTMRLEATGQISVRDTGSLVAAVIDAPWAVDADLELVPTHFEVHGDTFTQHVALPVEPERYPVVIDPRYTNLSHSIPHTRNGTARNYMRGFVRPEKDIAAERGYYPRWGNQNGVLRAVRQDGECSYYPDTGPYWDFQVACKSHDYCYDLRRVGGYVNVTRLGCDEEFKVAMYDDCAQRSSLAGVACRNDADTMYDAVRAFGRAASPRSVGDPPLVDDVGDGPDPGGRAPLPPGPWEYD